MYNRASHEAAPPYIFRLCTVEALAAFDWLVIIPGEGVSIPRTIMLSVLGVQFLAFAVWRRSHVIRPMAIPGEKTALRAKLLGGGALLTLACGLVLAVSMTLAATTGIASYRSYAERLQPLLARLDLMGLQGCCGLADPGFRPAHRFCGAA